MKTKFKKKTLLEIYLGTNLGKTLGTKLTRSAIKLTWCGTKCIVLKTH